ncbi:MAG TPA: AsnC family transcriptional regulator, partial [Halomonas sp.]|nr:AsnC family transcriptional regulator [Halomonas sp.]HCL24692.1 AsnC family transcriptional regulator [Halomonas sp.]
VMEEVKESFSLHIPDFEEFEDK